MAAVAGASWQRALMDTALFRVRGPLTRFMTETKLLLQMGCREGLLPVIEKVRAGFISHNASSGYSREAREELRRKFPGEYIFFPIADEAAAKSLPALFREAMMKAIKVQISTLLSHRNMSKSAIQFLHSHLQFCKQRISETAGPEKENWVAQLRAGQDNLEKIQELSFCKVTEEEGYEVVEAPDIMLQREIAQLTEWEKNPEALLDLASQDPDPDKSIFFVPTSQLPGVLLNMVGKVLENL